MSDLTSSEPRVLDVPCGCRLHLLFDPSWEGVPCAYSGPRQFRGPGGEPAFLALVLDPYAAMREEPTGPNVDLARLVLEGRSTMPLADWLDAIKAAAHEVLDRPAY